MKSEKNIKVLKAVVAVAIALALIMPGGLALIENEKITDEIISSSGSDNPSLGALQTDRYFFHENDMSGKAGDKKTIRLMLETTEELVGFGFTIGYDPAVLEVDFRYDDILETYYVNGTWEGTAGEPLILKIDPSNDDPSIHGFGGSATGFYCPPQVDIGEHVAYYFNITVKDTASVGLHEDAFEFIVTDILRSDFTSCDDITYIPEWINGDFEVLPPDDNEPPEFSNEDPYNTETNVPIGITELCIDINDPEGNSFDWTIDTSPYIGNGDGTGYNDTYCITVSGLDYDTIYSWTVNATDQYGASIEEIYTFTTELANNAPEMSDEIPDNTEQDVSLDLSELSVTITDHEGDSFDWSIEAYRNELDYSVNIGSSSGSDDGTGGIKTCPISPLLSTKEHIWYVNATDEHGADRSVYYTFSTDSTEPPVFSNPNPKPSSPKPEPTLSEVTIDIEDPDGDPFEWSIEVYRYEGMTINLFEKVGSNYSTGLEENGTKSCPISGLIYAGDYVWFVNASDEHGDHKEKKYTFSVKSSGYPIVENPDPYNGAGNVGIDIGEVTVNIADPEGHTLDWSIEVYKVEDDVLVEKVGSESDTDDTNGTKSCPVEELEHGASYKWFVNASDEHGATTRTEYSFRTMTYEPELDIVEVTGGFRISALIKNKGNADAENANVSIHVTGGILSLINKTFTETVDIPAGNETIVRSGFIFGLGPVEITVTASAPGGNEDTKKEDGLVLFCYTLIT